MKPPTGRLQQLLRDGHVFLLGGETGVCVIPTTNQCGRLVTWRGVPSHLIPSSRVISNSFFTVVGNPARLTGSWRKGGSEEVTQDGRDVKGCSDPQRDPRARGRTQPWSLWSCRLEGSATSGDSERAPVLPRGTSQETHNRQNKQVTTRVLEKCQALRSAEHMGRTEEWDLGGLRSGGTLCG